MSKKAGRHQQCSICRTIPDRSGAFWKGGEQLGGDLPRAESKLEIVGAPFYHDHTTHSHSCLKRCPECGTYYDWSFTYEFLVNGSEDEIDLTRLADKEGAGRARKLLESRDAAEAKFRSEAEPRLQALLHSPDGKGVYGAAHYLQGGQTRGHNIEFAIPALLDRFIKLAKLDGDDSYLDSCASLIYFVLSPVVKESPAVARQVLDTLRRHDLTTRDIQRVNWIIADCRAVLQSRK